MAILTKHPKSDGYKPGDSVTASVINDTIDTAIDANKKAAKVEQRANDGEFTVFNSPTASKLQVRNDGNLWLICTDEIAANYN